MIVGPHCVLHAGCFDHEMRPKGETGSHQENKPPHPEQSRRPEQGKQRDWIGEKAKSEKIHARPERPAAVIDTQNVVCMMDESVVTAAVLQRPDDS